MNTPERPSKRIRQACEPCRRKKSRCPGQKPVCSHCARLNQRCTYAPDPGRKTASPPHTALPDQLSSSWRDALNGSEESGTTERLRSLETQIAEMRRLMTHKPHSAGQASFPSSPRTAGPQPDLPRELHVRPSADAVKLPSWEMISAATELYLTYCNCQPLPLFSPQYLLETLASRDQELLLSLVAVAGRYSQHDTAASFQTFDSILGDEYAQEAKRAVLARTIRGPVELSTLQSLCILSMREFNYGNTAQASMFSSLAVGLSQSAGLCSEFSRYVLDHTVEERRRCYWSIVLLQNLHGYAAGSFAFVTDERTPKYPQSPQQPLGSSSEMTDAALEQPNGNGISNEPSDLGIVAYAIQLSDIWHRTTRYAHRRGKSSSLPAWSADSAYAQITAELMELETRLPFKYRFRPSRFAEQDSQQVQTHRAFWAPWLLVQMLYHSILCLLNHPLILSLRLRNFRVTMIPEIFLQHTADLTATHTEWIIHLLDISKEKNFRLTDPFLAHFVAIAATIYLQQSFTDDHTVRTEKQECFRKCVAFVRETGRLWPYVDQLANKIEQFERLVSTSFENSAGSSTPNASIFIDLNLFWEIIESSFASEIPEATNSIFGASLILHRHDSNSAEVLRSRLLPEPTRISHEGVTPLTSHARSVAGTTRQPSFSQHMSQFPVADPASSQDEGLSILAQSYFAQGQDFVGNMDDWWFSGSTI